MKLLLFIHALCFLLLQATIWAREFSVMQKNSLTSVIRLGCMQDTKNIGKAISTDLLQEKKMSDQKQTLYQLEQFFTRKEGLKFFVANDSVCYDANLRRIIVPLLIKNNASEKRWLDLYLSGTTTSGVWRFGEWGTCDSPEWTLYHGVDSFVDDIPIQYITYWEVPSKIKILNSYIPLTYKWILEIPSNGTCEIPVSFQLKESLKMGVYQLTLFTDTTCFDQHCDYVFIHTLWKDYSFCINSADWQIVNICEKMIDAGLIPYGWKSEQVSEICSNSIYSEENKDKHNKLMRDLINIYQKHKNNLRKK